jgi:hypothetical protein
MHEAGMGSSLEFLLVLETEGVRQVNIKMQVLACTIVNEIRDRPILDHKGFTATSTSPSLPGRRSEMPAPPASPMLPHLPERSKRSSPQPRPR